MMKRIFCFLVLSLVFLTGCAYSTYKTKQDSFTIGKTYSFDNAFYRKDIGQRALNIIKEK